MSPVRDDALQAISEPPHSLNLTLGGQRGVSRHHWRTTVLNFIFIGVAVAVWWLAKNKERFGGGQGYAFDPVCGMQIETARAPASKMHHGQKMYFCADRCLDRFTSDPERFASKRAMPEEPKSDELEHQSHVDPVCGMTVDPESAAAHRMLGVNEYYFCGLGCASTFDDEPDRYTSGASG